ncbi:MAG: hypothetical protein JO280_14905 [Mycobacteriaceae bacterium]|nr:hypothetical protein [Mycobacteriaceae bacterium]
MGNAFIGSQALRNGDLTRHQLRTQHRAIGPDVYVPRFTTVTMAERAYAAWLWSRRRGTVAGLTAAALLGAKWVHDDAAVELIWRNPRPPDGVITRNERLGVGETTVVNGLAVTTPARTAFDIGRHLPRKSAIARLDALSNATRVDAGDVAVLAERYRGARGLRRLRTAIALMDAGAQSPKETWLRLLLVDAGLPRPTTQIMVHDGDYIGLAYLDLGWEEFKVAAEYDGDQHRSDRRQYVHDISRSELLSDLGWVVVRVIAEDHPDDIVRRVRKALISRGFRDT